MHLSILHHECVVLYSFFNRAEFSQGCSWCAIGQAIGQLFESIWPCDDRRLVRVLCESSVHYDLQY
jgi:hypothetical protein